MTVPLHYISNLQRNDEEKYSARHVDLLTTEHQQAATQLSR